MYHAHDERKEAHAVGSFAIAASSEAPMISSYDRSLPCGEVHAKDYGIGLVTQPELRSGLTAKISTPEASHIVDRFRYQISKNEIANVVSICEKK